MKDLKIGTVVKITVAALLINLAFGFLLAGYAEAATPASTQAASPSPSVKQEIPIFSQILGGSSGQSGETFAISILEIIVRLLLAVVLSAALAFRPRKNVPLFQRNLSVAQTQILLAVVGAALMLIVGDNAARAFAIFAAVSLVRFRTNIRDPKEVTILLISLALGLATGVGHWDLGIVLCLFALVLLWFLERNEIEQVFRPMQLTVKAHDTEKAQQTLKKIFDKYKIEADVRKIEPPEEGQTVGSIVYYLDMRLSVSTDFLSEKILSDSFNNIEGIQWEQQKSTSNVYQ
jgi:uncharacterized membrane protein YhiD involved in acid resistance